MGILTNDIQEFVRKQKLGFIATVCPDSTPNLSPKGTTTVWDDDHLIFADIHSPGTINNLLTIEINIVDGFIRKGCRFKGTGMILSQGKLFEEILTFYNKNGFSHIIRNIVLVKVDRVLPIISPAYDRDISEEEGRQQWMEYWKFEQKI
jgi:uncharacterized protein